MTIIGRVGQVGRVRGDALCIGVIIYHGGSSVRHPKGARSIGIGHPRSGDRCTETFFTPSTPCGSPSRNPLSRRPARGRGLMRSLIHRSSALRASTDAYGTGILADAIMLSIYSRHRNPKDEDRPAAWHPGRGARFLDRMSRGAAPKTPVTDGSPKPPRPR